MSRPHDDALVLSLNVANVLLKRILVNTGSSAILPFSSALIEMKLEEPNIKDVKVPLIRFSGEQSCRWVILAYQFTLVESI